MVRISVSRKYERVPANGELSLLAAKLFPLVEEAVAASAEKARPLVHWEAGNDFPNPALISGNKE